MRAILFALAACLVLATVAAPGVSAAKEPVGVCDDDATVEVCAPVCITGPCLPYACVHGTVERCVRA